MSDTVKTAKVCWFDARKGIGFVSKDDGSGDLFVHWSNVEMDGFKTLKPGQVVSYELGSNHHGEQAVNVQVISEGEGEPDSEPEAEESKE